MQAEHPQEAHTGLQAGKGLYTGPPWLGAPAVHLVPSTQLR